MAIGKEVGDVSDTTLRFLRQIGVKHVGLPAQRRLSRSGAAP
jgi:hypothetical protein